MKTETNLISTIFSFLLSVFFITGFLWAFDFIDFSKGQEFRLSETFMHENNQFKRYNNVDFYPNAAQQSVIMKIHAPLAEKVAQDFNYRPPMIYNSSGDCEVNLSVEQCKKINSRLAESKMFVAVSKTFPISSESLVKLDNCKVLNKKNWLCETLLDTFIWQTAYIGKMDNAWLFDFQQKEFEFHNVELYESKIKWWLDKRKCGSICFLATKEEIILEREKIKTILKNNLFVKPNTD